MIDLNESQYWSLDKLKAFQNERLGKMLSYVYNNIPAYRKKFNEAGIRPEDIMTTDDLYKLPITTREEMQNNPDFINEELIIEPLFTGGSTGSSLKYYDSQESKNIRWNAHLRGWSWNGYIPGKRLVVVTSAQGIIGGNNTLNLFGGLTTENLKRNVEKILEFKPQHLRGYVSSLYILAKYCLDNDIQIEGIESIDPISENLYDFQRELMEKAFRCPVFEEYCCNDGGACAWECEAHEGLHYFMERAVIEEIDGEIITTDLWNKAMPFIRYRNGDAVKFLEKRCSCGRELPLLEVKGRTNDILISKNGPVSPTYVMHSWYDGSQFESHKDFRSGFRAVQYIQKKDFFLVVNVVKNSNCTEEMTEGFKEQLRKIFPGMTYEINFVDDIPKSAKGKRSFIINKDKELLKKWGF